MVTVREADRSDVGALSRVLARAFADDPVVAWLVPTQRRQERFFAATAAIYFGLGEIYTTADGTGVGMWARPGARRPGLWPVARTAPDMLRALRTNVPRGLRVKNLVEGHHPRQPHWYLSVLGTDPDHQGQGIGSALMAPVLSRCDEEGVLAYLESSKESNIAFYARHGFEVTDELQVPRGPRLWPMVREPR